jgi:hypothetical protein
MQPRRDRCPEDRVESVFHVTNSGYRRSTDRGVVTLVEFDSRELLDEALEVIDGVVAALDDESDGIWLRR